MSSKKKKSSETIGGNTKKQKRTVTYSKVYTDEWSFIVASQKGPEYVHCRILSQLSSLTTKVKVTSDAGEGEKDSESYD